jgi:hypothetical protein
MTSVLAASVDRAEGAEWFYSTLAEVSATIVGFLGAFLVIRLHASMDEWRRESRRVEESRRVLARLQEQVRTGVSVRDTERARAALDELVATADRQHLARFPAELTVGAVILGGLLSVGVIAPLVALDAPDDAVQVAFLLPFAALSMLAAGVMYFYAVLAWRAWQALPLDAWHAQHARTVEDVDRPLPPA